MEFSKQDEYTTSVVGLALMYPCFLAFGLFDLTVAPIRFVNDRVKNEKGESITEILRDSFKIPVNREA